MASITMWNNPRPNTKLLVLDIDETIADYHGMPVMLQKKANARNHLHYFLTEIYKYYDIAVWSATSIKFIIKKLETLDMLTNKNFKILFALDISFMSPVSSRIFGDVLVKPLSVIWENIKQFNRKNTIMVDDQEKNFFRNPNNGLKVLPYFSQNHDTDVELFSLAKYLTDIAKTSTNFSEEDLEDWISYVPLSYRLV